MTLRRRLRLMTHPWRLNVERLPRDAAAPLPSSRDNLFAVVRTQESLTVVREADESFKGSAWRALEIAGPFPFSESGVLAAVAGPLAEAGVSIFAVNSYETEYVLVQEPDLERARAALEQVGHQLD
jgi:uncharacterized protein